MNKYVKGKKANGKRRPDQLPHRHSEDTISKSFGREALETMLISSSIAQNMEKVNEIIGDNSDLVIRNITLGREKTRPAVIIYLDNQVDSHHIDKDIIRPLVLDAYTSGLQTGEEIIKQLHAGNIVTRGQFAAVGNLYEFLNGILTGETGLLIEEMNEAYVISTKGYEYRDISESVTEPVVRGPKEAFNEILSINIGLIRKRIHSPNLVFESLELGKVSKTKVCIAYIKDICPADLLEETRSRLEKISIDSIQESSYIEEFIQDNPYSVFPQVRNTERPDVVASSLLEGRVAIIVDNTPIALIVPGEFFTLLQSAEDYYTRYTFSSLIRILRYVALLISLLLPALYIAITDYHQEMIPTSLLTSIISARAKVPIPAYLEAFVMQITFEILYEAGLRLPRTVGQTVSIVGALVIGQAAVQANLVSPLMVIVVALTGIAKFSLPQYNITLPIRILRFIFMLLATVLGMFGVMVGVLFLMLHLFSMESFGKPYMAPLSPLRIGDLKDTMVRAPWWALVKRPAYSSLDSKRMRSGQMPRPPKKEGS